MPKETKIYRRCDKDLAKDVDLGYCTTVEQQIKEGKIPNITPPSSGLFHTIGPPQPIHFKPARNGLAMQQQGAYIVLGSDRPSSVRSGYGGAGSTAAATIDLVVGRMASARGGKGPKEGSFVDNSFSADAARVYISQLTDVDKNFDLASSPLLGRGTFKQNECSAIALKADAIRIIGRQGIKIVTGKMKGVKGDGPGGEPNSRGGVIDTPAPPIHLIAGNSITPRFVEGNKYMAPALVDTLQPIPLGNNVRDAFLELDDIIGHLWSAVFNFALVQTGQNVAFGVSPFAWHGAAVSAAVPQSLSYVMNSLYHTRANAKMWRMNYLVNPGYRYICSENVKTT
jgi:hypothetical protein